MRNQSSRSASANRPKPNRWQVHQRNASRIGLIWLGGGLVCLAACNRAEPEKTTDAKDVSAQSSPLSGGPDSSQLASSTSAAAAPNQSSDGLASRAGNAMVSPPPGGASATAGKVTTANGPGGGSSVAPASGTQASDPAGVHIEFSNPSFPTTGLETESSAAADDVAQRLSDRAFMQLKLPESNDASALMAFFVDCDRSVQDLAIANRAQQLSEKEFHEQAKRLSGLKLEAAQRLLAQPSLTPQQQKAGTAAQVESLSHLTGLGDVQAAQKLQALAEGLTKSNDAQLAHQGKLVLLGFRLNQLQEGQLKDPQSLIAEIDQLFVRAEDRSLVEMMALQRCAEVLAQLGYDKESKQVLERVVRNYRNSPDVDLSMRAWSIETDGAPTLAAFHDALKAVFEGKAEDNSAAAAANVAGAARAFWEAFPSINTLLYISRSMIPLEFSGNVAAASQVAKVVADARGQLSNGPLVEEIDAFLDCHARRLAAVGQPLVLEGLANFDGKPFDWSSYRGKVVLVCFWASWEINSLDEMRRLKELRRQIPSADFEILAINLDDTNMPGAEQMVFEQNYSWANVRSSNPTAQGFSTPAAVELGVNAVPFVMLVDRQGKVAAIHVRGQNTAQMVNELLTR